MTDFLFTIPLLALLLFLLLFRDASVALASSVVSWTESSLWAIQHFQVQAATENISHIDRTSFQFSSEQFFL